MGRSTREAITSGRRAPPTNRLFHLHYHVPDIEHAERALAERGLPLHARFGWVDDELIAVRPDEEIPEGFRFRLQDAQRGYANVTITSGAGVQFDHLGIISSDYDGILERAEAAGWRIQGADTLRTFLFTPWGFRVEVHPEGGRIEESLASWDACRFEPVRLAIDEAESVVEGFDAVVGPLPQLTIVEGSGEPAVPRATLIGSGVSQPSRLLARDLAAER